MESPPPPKKKKKKNRLNPLNMGTYNYISKLLDLQQYYLCSYKKRYMYTYIYNSIIDIHNCVMGKYGWNPVSFQCAVMDTHNAIILNVNNSNIDGIHHLIMNIHSATIDIHNCWELGMSLSELWKSINEWSISIIEI